MNLGWSRIKRWWKGAPKPDAEVLLTQLRAARAELEQAEKRLSELRANNREWPLIKKACARCKRSVDAWRTFGDGKVICLDPACVTAENRARARKGRAS